MQGCQAQRVDPAHDCRIDEPGGDRALRAGEDLAAGGARGGDDGGGALEPQGMACKGGDRETVVGPCIAKLRGQGAAVRVARCEGKLGLEDARGTGSQKYPDARGTVTPEAGAHALVKPILQEAKVGEAVVAAVEFGQLRRQPHGLHGAHLAHVRIQAKGHRGTRRKA